MQRALVFSASVSLVSCSFASTDATFREEGISIASPAPQVGASFGVTLAMDGKSLVIAEPLARVNEHARAGAAYVFEEKNGKWLPTRIGIPDTQDTAGEVDVTLLPKEVPLRIIGLPAWPAMRVAMSSSFIAVSLPGYDGTSGDQLDSGRVCIFNRAAIDRELGCVQAPDPDHQDLFGFSLALLEAKGGAARLVVGAPRALSKSRDDTSTAGVKGGAAYTFTYSKDTGRFEYEDKVYAPAPVLEDYFGAAVALREDQIAIGAPAEDSGTTGVQDADQPDDKRLTSGAVYTYRQRGAAWSFDKYIKPVINGDTATLFGISVSFSGDNLAIGAPGAKGCSISDQLTAGAVYIATEVAGAWTLSAEDCLTTIDDRALGGFGFSLHLSGDKLAVGAPVDSSFRTDLKSQSFSGAAYLFQRKGSRKFSEVEFLKSNRVHVKDLFGTAVALSPEFLAVGEPQAFGEAADFGVVYLYRLP